MEARLLVPLLALTLGSSVTAYAAPTTVAGDPFTLVGMGGGTPLFGLTSDAAGRIYIGNNSNDATGIAVQLFDPALFTGTAISLQNFGPAVGDADGIASFGDSIFVADGPEGIRQLAVADAANSIYLAGVATNATGSPFVFRPSDGHLFVGQGGLTGIDRIDEYDATGAFLVSHTTGTDVETMTYDPAAGLIYYAPFGPEVRALNPVTNVDRSVGMSSGTIDGGLTFDSILGVLFVGTANGTNSGLVETMDPSTGVAQLFASGFNGSVGILREPVSGDLYFLEATQLYRLPSSAVTTTTTSTVSTSTTTSTTLAGCLGVPDGPTFASVVCRLEALLARVSAEAGLGTFQPKLTHTLTKGRDRATQGRDLCAASNAKKSKSRLKQVGRALIQYVHRLAGLPARKKLDDALRREFLNEGSAIEPDVGTLRKNLHCPAAAGS